MTFTGAAGATTCQHAVTSQEVAPDYTSSAGIRQDNGISNVIYNNNFGAGQVCRFVNNASGNSLFVPQGSQSDFSAFINNVPSGVTLSSCVNGKTITATPSITNSSFEIFSDGGAITAPSGSVASISGIQVPTSFTGNDFANAPNNIIHYTGSSQSTTVTLQNGNANAPSIAFVYARKDCVHSLDPNDPTCAAYNQRYVEEAQSIRMPVTSSGSGDTLAYNWGNPTVTSTYYISGSASGPWTNANKMTAVDPSCGNLPTCDYDPPTTCAPGYVAGDTWVTTGSTAGVSCPSGFIGSYTQNFNKNYTCQSNGVATYTTTNTTNTESSQCLPIINGACSTATNGKDFASAPTSNLCSSGNASAVTPTSYVTWGWTCNGSNTGSSATCSANLIVNGACGPTNGANVSASSPPTSGLCSSGIASAVNQYIFLWYWTCGGLNSGSTSPTCIANMTINGTCGSSNKATLTSAPTANLCSLGTASTVSGSGPWSWKCTGFGGGTTANCQTCSPSNVTLSSYYDTGPDPVGIDNPGPEHTVTTNTLDICSMIFISNGQPFSVTTNTAGSHWQPGIVTWNFTKGTASTQTFTPGSGDDNKSTTATIYYDGSCSVYATAKGNRINGTDYHAVEIALTTLATTAASCP